MDNKDTMTTQRVRTVGFIAACFTIVGALSIWRLFIEGEETALNWLWLAAIPYAISQWVAVFRRVESRILEIFAGVGIVVIWLVGWYRTEDWPPPYYMAMVFAFAIVFFITVWGTRRYYQTKD